MFLHLYVSHSVRSGHRSGRYASYWNAYLFSLISSRNSHLFNLLCTGERRQSTIYVNDSQLRWQSHSKRLQPQISNRYTHSQNVSVLHGVNGKKPSLIPISSLTTLCCSCCGCCLTRWTLETNELILFILVETFFTIHALKEPNVIKSARRTGVCD